MTNSNPNLSEKLPINTNKLASDDIVFDNKNDQSFYLEKRYCPECGIE